MEGTGIDLSKKVWYRYKLLSAERRFRGDSVVDPNPAFQVNPDPDTDPGF